MRKWWWLVLSIGLAACSEEDLARTLGDVAAAPSALDFGGVFVGEKKALAVTLRNDGRAEVVLDAVELPNGFRAEPAELRIPAASSAKWTVTFEPQVAGEARGEAALTFANAHEPRLTIPLAGVGVVRDVAVAESLDFGSVPVGETVRLRLAVESRSQAPLTVELSLTGIEAAAFSIRQSVLELPPGATGEVEVSFTPPVRGPRSASLELLSCAECDPVKVRLRGRGVVKHLTISPLVVDFGMVSPGGRLVRTVDLENAGDLAIRVEAASLAEDGGPDFSVDRSPLPFELAPGERRTLEVAFAPPEDAERVQQQGALRLSLDDGSQAEIQLVGTPGGPVIQVDPAFVDFGLQPVGLAVARAISIRNAGEPGSVRVLGAYVEGANAAVFSPHPQDALPFDVAADALSIAVTFEATADGPYGGDLVLVTDDDERQLIRVPLQGVGRTGVPCDLRVIPGELRFGLVPNTDPTVRSVEVRNDGVEDCLIWDVALEEGGSPLFSLAGVPQDTTVLPAGGRLPLAVRFSPGGATESLFRGTLAFSHSTPDTPRMRIPVSAFPSRYRLEATPNPLDLGAWPIGFRTVETLDVKNVGAFNVEVTGAEIASGVPDSFEASPAFGLPGRLVPEQEGAFHVTFRPLVPGGADGQLFIRIREAPEPFVVDLRGRGTDEECGILCAGPAAFCPAPQTVNVNTQIQLLGYGTDPTDDPLTCTWAVSSSPQGSSAAPDNPAQCTTTFTPDLVGDYELQLTVRDPMGNEASCTTQVHADPHGGIWVEVFWNPAQDIDLHLMHLGVGNPLVYADWEDATKTCFYANCDPPDVVEWDLPGPNDNPSLDRDDIPGTGPENIRISVPSTSHAYGIGIRNYNNPNFPVSVTVNVYCGGTLLHGQVYTSNQVKEIVYVGSVTYADPGPCSFVHDGTILQQP